MGPEEFAEQIAQYHEDGMGFGVLVKLYAMAEASLEDCLIQSANTEIVDPTLITCEPVTVEQMVSEFTSGSGMGQLFKEYGKPALLGVGHVRKALQNLPQATMTPTPTTIVTPSATPVPPTASGDVQFGNQKSNNGNGNDNGNGNGNNNSNSHKPVKVKTPNPHKPNK